MATFTLKLDDDTLRKLTEAARRAGVTPERMAESMLETWILADDDLPASPGVGEPARAWTSATDEGDDPREEIAANHDLNEVGRPWSEVRPEFVALIDKTFGKAE
ncbi:MAG: hypothetical protein PSV23_11670 [Brevundimonas sp.]|uniref:hypothetical protein n=1 Tax=Brevundimonas sp. TaxID=1871086 RepID=UPI002488C911|nr:hypothetical protein [Brevundimonas sp.]MDI1327443.1 hypothetical protein [Brevundimonas sp.]